MAEARANDKEVEDLIRSLRDGDSRGVSGFYDKYREVIYRHVGFANSRRVTAQDAEEITQDTFVRAFRSAESFRGQSSVKTWLLTLARNAGTDHFRGSRNRYGRASVISDASVAYSGASPEEQLEQVRQIEMIREALFRLSRDHRAVITYRLFDGLSVKETAQLMERSESAIKQLQLRAIRALRVTVREDVTAEDRPLHTEQRGRT